MSHYGDVTMGAIASQITSITIVYSTVYPDAYQRKHQSSASLGGPVNSPHKWPVTRKMFPFDDVIMRAKHIPKLSAYNISHKMLTYHISFIFDYNKKHFLCIYHFFSLIMIRHIQGRFTDTGESQCPGVNKLTLKNIC